MGNEYRAKVFKSGNSVALRLPKALGLKEGQEMVVREEAGKFEFEPVAATPRKFNVDAFWGTIPELKPFTPEERLFEERELDWEGKLLKRQD
jgi:antitoxin VapB